METAQQELLTFFKALSDSSRLRIIGLLAGEPLSVEQLAEMLNLRPSTVSHHLARLSEAGLVSARPESYYNVYQFEPKMLENMAQRLLTQETVSALAADVDTDAYDRKVLQSFIAADGRIKSFPSQQKKFEVILRYVRQAFEIGTRYPEKQVNQILSRYSDDTASLRRALVEYKYMAREGGGGEYWRIV